MLRKELRDVLRGTTRRDTEGTGARSQTGEAPRVGPFAMCSPWSRRAGLELVRQALGKPQIAEPGAGVALALDHDPVRAAADLDSLPPF